MKYNLFLVTINIYFTMEKMVFTIYEEVGCNMVEIKFIYTLFE